MNIRPLFNTDIHFDSTYFWAPKKHEFDEKIATANPYWSLYWSKERPLEVEIKSQQLSLAVKKFLLIPPFIPLKILHLGKGRALCMRFYFPLEFKDKNRSYYCVDSLPSEKEDLEQYFTMSLDTEITELDTFRPNYKLSLFAKIILYKLFFRLDDELLEADEQNRIFHDLIFRLLMHPEEEMSTQQMAETMKMPLRSFNEYVKYTVGMPPRLFFNHLRLGKSWNWLRRTDWSIEDIALKLGFPDRYNFSYAFKKLYNLSPAKVRKDAKKWKEDGLPVIP